MMNEWLPTSASLAESDRSRSFRRLLTASKSLAVDLSEA